MARTRKRGEGTVYKRRDGRWVAELRFPDRRVSLYAHTEEEALARLASARQAAVVTKVAVPPPSGLVTTPPGKRQLWMPPTLSMPQLEELSGFPRAALEDLADQKNWPVIADRLGRRRWVVGETRVFDDMGLRERPERWFRDQLAAGQPERRIERGYGRPDFITDRLVFEVEPLRSWSHGAQQAIAYAAMSHREPVLALYGLAGADRIEWLYRRLATGRPSMHLWWFSHGSWQHISSVAASHRAATATHTIFEAQK